ncbi:hypothetical protein WN51_12976 [Melipona quadrifasciata]|uniref:Uncharacterized protein n=1 Tax=Melipona quadrifasciata TaxID=166423 RepID=A0A0M9ACJ3_9HYME|nr:hypothetical protein WN51_12976 [Melipona quadrifasciata]
MAKTINESRKVTVNVPKDSDNCGKRSGTCGGNTETDETVQVDCPGTGVSTLETIPPNPCIIDPTRAARPFSLPRGFSLPKTLVLFKAMFSMDISCSIKRVRRHILRRLHTVRVTLGAFRHFVCTNLIDTVMLDLWHSDSQDFESCSLKRSLYSLHQQRVQNSGAVGSSRPRSQRRRRDELGFQLIIEAPPEIVVPTLAAGKFGILKIFHSQGFSIEAKTRCSTTLQQRVCVCHPEICQFARGDVGSNFAEIRGQKIAGQAAKDGSPVRASWFDSRREVKGLVYGTPAGQNSSTWYPFLDGRIKLYLVSQKNTQIMNINRQSCYDDDTLNFTGRF